MESTFPNSSFHSTPVGLLSLIIHSNFQVSEEFCLKNDSTDNFCAQRCYKWYEQTGCALEIDMFSQLHRIHLFLAFFAVKLHFRVLAPTIDAEHKGLLFCIFNAEAHRLNKRSHLVYRHAPTELKLKWDTQWSSPSIWASSN